MRAQILAGGTLLTFAGCAGLSVQQVTDENRATIRGIHYYLPKPYIQVAPQANGTVAVAVIYLPDTDHEYAIDTSSTFSSYTFQVSRDINHLLTEVEFKASTAPVGQQLASSASAAAVQQYNIQAAQAAAVQTQVNAAQATVDIQNTAVQVAKAALAADTQSHQTDPTSVTATQLAQDQSAYQQALQKLSVAQQALQRWQKTAQAVSNAATAGSITSTTAPTMGTIFGSPTWTQPTSLSLPDKYGPVLFAIDDKRASDGSHVIALLSEKGAVPGTSLTATATGVVVAAQPAFETKGTSASVPKLEPDKLKASLAVGTATFVFNQPITKLNSATVVTDTTPQVDTKVAGRLKDPTTVTVDISTLTEGSYILTVSFVYKTVDGKPVPITVQTLHFTVIP